LAVGGNKDKEWMMVKCLILFVGFMQVLCLSLSNPVGLIILRLKTYSEKTKYYWSLAEKEIKFELRLIICLFAYF
jgi:hypothetical protein